MSALDKARKHFAAFKRQKIEVPEWEMDLYFDPLTLAQIRKVKDVSEQVGRAKILLEYVKDADGSPVFPDVPEPDMIKAVAEELDPIITGRIAEAVLARREPGEMVDDMGKP